MNSDLISRFLEALARVSGQAGMLVLLILFVQKVFILPALDSALALRALAARRRAPAVARVAPGWRECFQSLSPRRGEGRSEVDPSFARSPRAA